MGCDLRIRVLYKQRHLPEEVGEMADKSKYCTECSFVRCETCENADKELSKYVSEWDVSPSHIPVSRHNKVLMLEIGWTVMSKEDIKDKIREWSEMLSLTINDIQKNTFEDLSEAIVVLNKINKEFREGQFIEIDYS